MKKAVHIVLRIAITIAFAAVFLVAYGKLDKLLSVKSGHGINQTKSMYYQPRDTIDVLFMGSSHVHCNVNTGLLWEEFGMAAHDFSAAEQPLWMTYYYLKEGLRYQKPKVVVIDMYSPARFKDDYHYDWIEENLHGMKFSFDKVAMVAASIERERWSEFFPSFATYHARYNELTEEDYQAVDVMDDNLLVFKGYTPYMGVEEQPRPEYYDVPPGGLTEKSEKYLRKIIDYCKQKNVGLVLMAAPYILAYDDEMTFQHINLVAQETGTTFINFNHLYDEIGTDFATDYYDFSHLNYWGGQKFTRYLGNRIKELYDIPDHRGDPAYESWDRNAKWVHEYTGE